MGGDARAGRGACARVCALLLASASGFIGTPAVAQPTDPSPPTAPEPPSPPGAASPPATPTARPERLAPVQITGSRPDDVQERRNSTAAKIIIGRDEIERFGDSTLGDVLKRLPGVTIQGRPGRGGGIA